jgi:hypothetical protein
MFTTAGAASFTNGAKESLISAREAGVLVFSAPIAETAQIRPQIKTGVIKTTPSPWNLFKHMPLF